MTRISHPGWGLVGWMALSCAAAAVGVLFTPGDWYADLIKPDWTPPDAVFPVVWTVLYIAMAVAAWRVWCQHGFATAGSALTLYLAQLLLNGLWSWLFFGLHAIGAALIEIVLLWLLIAATTLAFWRLDRPAGLLLAPYLCWVSLAVALNYSIWQLNS